MPLIDDDAIATIYDPIANTEKPIEEVQHDSLDIWAAGFRKENIVSSATDKILNRYQGDETLDASFDPYEDDYLEGYEPFVSRFSEVRNKGHADNIKHAIDRELRDMQILDESGFEGSLARFTAAVVDPITFVGALVAPELVVGGKILSSAAKMSAFAITDQAVRETILHQTQETRTLEESVFNTIGAGVVGSVLGAGVSKLTSQQFNTLSNQVADDILNPTLPTHQSAGSAAVQTTTMEDETLIKAFGLESGERAFLTPNLRLSNSQSHTARTVQQELSMDALARNKNADGISTPHSAEIEIARYDTLRADARTAVLKGRKDFRSSTISGDELADELTRAGMDINKLDVIANPNAYKSYNHFSALVAGALRNGDRSAFPQVTTVAQAIRQKIFTPMAKEAVDSGLLKAEELAVDTADSYLTRIWNREKIIAHRHILKQRFEQWIKSQNNELADEAGIIADDVLNTLTGSDGSMVNAVIMKDLVAKAGPLKARTLLIPDNQVADFLEKDIIQIVDRYVRDVAADITLTKKFGNKDMSDQLSKVADEYTELKNAAHKQYQDATQGKTADEVKPLTDDLPPKKWTPFYLPC